MSFEIIIVFMKLHATNPMPKAFASLVILVELTNTDHTF